MTRIIESREVSDAWGGPRRGSGRKAEPFEGEKYVKIRCKPEQVEALFAYYRKLTGKTGRRGGPGNSKGACVFKCTFEQARELKLFLKEGVKI